MKLLYIVLVNLVFVYAAVDVKAQTISFPDKNFKDALIDLGLDTNKDGNIQKSEVANVKELYVVKAGITSLAGIKNFTSLEDHGFYENKLKTVDLEGMKTLKFIYGFRNEITQIKLKGCSNLEILALDNNELSSIDLNGLTKLREIDINWNKLQRVDLSDTPKLVKAWLWDNQITSFKANGSPELKDLKLNKNLIEEIDLRPLTQLISVSLNDNPLRKVNVTGLSALETLNCEGIGRRSFLTQLNTSGLISLKECKW